MIEGRGSKWHGDRKVIKERELNCQDNEEDPQEDALYHHYFEPGDQKLILKFKTFL